MNVQSIPLLFVRVSGSLPFSHACTRVGDTNAQSFVCVRARSRLHFRFLENENEKGEPVSSVHIDAAFFHGLFYISMKSRALVDAI